MKRSTIYIGAIALLPLHAIAQSALEATQIAREEVTGSARTISMGGAFTALGGDLSGVYINPAGIAVFRSNEFSISPAFHTNISNTGYYGQSTLDSKANFNVATIGLVGVKNLNQSGKWRSTAIGFGMHRSYSYHTAYTASAYDVPSSLIDAYIKTIYQTGTTPQDFATTIPAYPFDIYLAWNNYLIDTLGGPGYFNATGIMPVDQEYSVEQSGAKRETFLSFGANYDDKLYIGGGALISRVQRERAFSHTEFIDPADSTTILKDHTFNYTEEISGYGIGLNLGLIYRPIEQVRLGLSAKSPTIYRLNLAYETSGLSVFEYEDGTQDVFETVSPVIGDYDFRLTSPLQASVGAAYLFGRSGMLSADLEFVNYSGMGMRGISDSYQFGPENQAIASLLKPTFNLKFGGEYRITQLFSLRAGYANFGNPYETAVDNFGGFELYSVGAGYRTDDWFLDGAYQYKASTSKEFIYDPELVDALSTAFTDHRFTLTFGFKF